MSPNKIDTNQNDSIYYIISTVSFYSGYVENNIVYVHIIWIELNRPDSNIAKVFTAKSISLNKTVVKPSEIFIVICWTYTSDDNWPHLLLFVLKKFSDTQIFVC